MTIKKLAFKNYKALENFSIELREINILTGPNNGGKSTLISAFKILDALIKKAKSRKSEIIKFPDGARRHGYKINIDGISIASENIATNYNDEPSSIEFILHSGNKITLHFHESECFAELSCDGAHSYTPKSFEKNFPITLCVVPTLGPLEQMEVLVTEETIRSSLNSHRASRHFRNYWHNNRDHWDDFASLIESTWPGITVKPPELVTGETPYLTLFCEEKRMSREVAWAGFGFQVWLQLLTHISRSRANDIIIIDEPEIYLHPEIQRQILSILKNTGSAVIVATHSTEIIGEADPNEILIVDKGKNKAERLRDINGIQRAIDSLGSVHNVTLAQLARNRKMAFFEGKNDQKIIRRFAKILGFDAIASGNEITFFESDGFTSQEKIRNMTEGMKKTLPVQFKICAIYDRDFFCDEQISESIDYMENCLEFSHFHKRKEIENYLLNENAICRCLARELRARDKEVPESLQEWVAELLSQLIDAQKHHIQSQLISKKQNFLKDPEKISQQ